MQVLQPHLHPAGSVVPAEDAGAKTEQDVDASAAQNGSAQDTSSANPSRNGTGAAEGGNSLADDAGVVPSFTADGGEPRAFGPSSSDGGGCSASPARSGAGGYPLGVLALGLVVGARRLSLRRRRNEAR
jgi:hypothetical protein